MAAYVKTWQEYAKEEIQRTQWQKKHSLEQKIEQSQREIILEEKFLINKKKTLQQLRTSLREVNKEIKNNEIIEEENLSEDSSYDSSDDSTSSDQVTAYELSIEEVVGNVEEVVGNVEEVVGNIEEIIGNVEEVVGGAIDAQKSRKIGRKKRPKKESGRS